MNDEAETYFAPVVVPPPMPTSEREAIRARGRARILQAAERAIRASLGQPAGEVDDVTDETPAPPARVIPFPAPAQQPEPLTAAARSIAAHNRVVAAFEKHFPPRPR